MLSLCLNLLFCIVSFVPAYFDHGERWKAFRTAKGKEKWPSGLKELLGQVLCVLRRMTYAGIKETPDSPPFTNDFTRTMHVTYIAADGKYRSERPVAFPRDREGTDGGKLFREIVFEISILTTERTGGLC